MSDNMKTTIKILQYQMLVPRPDAEGVKDPNMIKTEALLLAERACQAAKDAGVDMVCLPEMFCCPYETKNFPAYAEYEGGMVWSKCADLAREYGIYLSAGSMPELAMESDMGCMPSSHVYNTAYVFDRERETVFVAESGLMLSAVIHKGSAYLFHKGNETHISNKDNYFQNSLKR